MFDCEGEVVISNKALVHIFCKESNAQRAIQVIVSRIIMSSLNTAVQILIISLSCPLTHTVTHTGKRAGRIGENIRPNYFTISELNRLKRSGKGWTNFPSAAHNPEVVGSNPSPATKVIA